jgi:uncharacterized membrane protein YoaK (UPF0700 family)
LINKLPKWVELGATLLAFIAGFINAIGLLSFEHQSVSHLSGTATVLGISFLDFDLATTAKFAAIIAAFIIGAMIAGFFINSRALKLGRHYDTMLFIEALLILLSIQLLQNYFIWGQLTLSAACGIQNAMATRYSGAVIRTTHLTGLFTDIGIMLGKYFKGDGFDKRKFILFTLIVIGFIAGGASAAISFVKFNFNALFIPFICCFILAIWYRFLVIKKRKTPKS